MVLLKDDVMSKGVLFDKSVGIFSLRWEVKFMWFMKRDSTKRKRKMPGFRLYLEMRE